MKKIKETLEEKQIGANYNEIDENSPDIILRTIINFEIYDSTTSKYCSIADIGKNILSAHVVGDIIEPLPYWYRQRIADLSCTVRQEADVVDQTQLSKYVHEHLAKLDRKALKVGDSVDGYCVKTLKWYEAKILDIKEQHDKTLFSVHFKGWSSKYNEWIDSNSDRLQPVGSSQLIMAEAVLNANKLAPWFDCSELYRKSIESIENEVGSAGFSRSSIEKRSVQRVRIDNIIDWCIDYTYAQPSLWLVAESGIWYRLAGPLVGPLPIYASLITPTKTKKSSKLLENRGISVVGGGYPSKDYISMFMRTFDVYYMTTHIVYAIHDMCNNNPNVGINTILDEVEARTGGTVNEVCVLAKHEAIIEQLYTVEFPEEWQTVDIENESSTDNCDNFSASTAKSKQTYIESNAAALNNSPNNRIPCLRELRKQAVRYENAGGFCNILNNKSEVSRLIKERVKEIRNVISKNNSSCGNSSSMTLKQHHMHIVENGSILMITMSDLFPWIVPGLSEEFLDMEADSQEDKDSQEDLEGSDGKDRNSISLGELYFSYHKALNDGRTLGKRMTYPIEDNTLMVLRILQFCHKQITNGVDLSDASINAVIPSRPEALRQLLSEQGDVNIVLSDWSPASIIHNVANITPDGVPNTAPTATTASPSILPYRKGCIQKISTEMVKEIVPLWALIVNFHSILLHTDGENYSEIGYEHMLSMYMYHGLNPADIKCAHTDTGTIVNQIENVSICKHLKSIDDVIHTLFSLDYMVDMLVDRNVVEIEKCGETKEIGNGNSLSASLKKRSNTNPVILDLQLTLLSIIIRDKLLKLNQLEGFDYKASYLNADNAATLRALDSNIASDNVADLNTYTTPALYEKTMDALQLHGMDESYLAITSCFELYQYYKIKMGYDASGLLDIHPNVQLALSKEKEGDCVVKRGRPKSLVTITPDTVPVAECIRKSVRSAEDMKVCLDYSLLRNPSSSFLSFDIFFPCMFDTPSMEHEVGNPSTELSEGSIARLQQHKIRCMLESLGEESILEIVRLLLPSDEAPALSMDSTSEHVASKNTIQSASPYFDMFVECENIIKEMLILHSPSILPFTHPVDELYDTATDYKSIIKKPMDISTVLYRITTGYYYCDDNVRPVKDIIDSLNVGTVDELGDSVKEYSQPGISSEMKEFLLKMSMLHHSDTNTNSNTISETDRLFALIQDVNQIWYNCEFYLGGYDKTEADAEAVAQITEKDEPTGDSIEVESEDVEEEADSLLDVAVFLWKCFDEQVFNRIIQPTLARIHLDDTLEVECFDFLCQDRTMLMELHKIEQELVRNNAAANGTTSVNTAKPRKSIGKPIEISTELLSDIRSKSMQNANKDTIQGKDTDDNSIEKLVDTLKYKHSVMDDVPLVNLLHTKLTYNEYTVGKRIEILQFLCDAVMETDYVRNYIDMTAANTCENPENPSNALFNSSAHVLYTQQYEEECRKTQRDLRKEDKFMDGTDRVSRRTEGPLITEKVPANRTLPLVRLNCLGKDRDESMYYSFDLVPRAEPEVKQLPLVPLINTNPLDVDLVSNATATSMVPVTDNVFETNIPISVDPSAPLILEEVTLILCDGCDGEFTLEQANLTEIPSGDWYCSVCSRKHKKNAEGECYTTSLVKANTQETASTWIQHYKPSKTVVYCFPNSYASAPYTLCTSKITYNSSADMKRLIDWCDEKGISERKLRKQLNSMYHGHYANEIGMNGNGEGGTHQLKSGESYHSSHTVINGVSGVHEKGLDLPPRVLSRGRKRKCDSIENETEAHGNTNPCNTDVDTVASTQTLSMNTSFHRDNVSTLLFVRIDMHLEEGLRPPSLGIGVKPLSNGVVVTSFVTPKTHMHTSINSNVDKNPPILESLGKKAGLLVGDQILVINGETVTDVPQLQAILKKSYEEYLKQNNTRMLYTHILVLRNSKPLEYSVGLKEASLVDIPMLEVLRTQSEVHSLAKVSGELEKVEHCHTYLGSIINKMMLLLHHKYSPLKPPARGASNNINGFAGGIGATNSDGNVNATTPNTHLASTPTPVAAPISTPGPSTPVDLHVASQARNHHNDCLICVQKYISLFFIAMSITQQINDIRCSVASIDYKVPTESANVPVEESKVEQMLHSWYATLLKTLNYTKSGPKQFEKYWASAINRYKPLMKDSILSSQQDSDASDSIGRIYIQRIAFMVVQCIVIDMLKEFMLEIEAILYDYNNMCMTHSATGTGAGAAFTAASTMNTAGSGTPNKEKEINSLDWYNSLLNTDYWDSIGANVKKTPLVATMKRRSQWRKNVSSAVTLSQLVLLTGNLLMIPSWCILPKSALKISAPSSSNGYLQKKVKKEHIKKMLSNKDMFQFNCINWIFLNKAF